MVETASTSQEQELNQAHLRFTNYSDLGNLKKLKLIMEQVIIYAQKRRTEKLEILDVGCGRGDVSFPILSLGHSVTGIDISPEVALACENKKREYGFADAEFLVADVQSFNLGKRFDLIICSEVLEHIPHPDLVVANFDKHLKKGGIIVVTVPNGYCLHEILVNRLAAKTMAAMVRRNKLLNRVINLMGVPTNTDYFTNPYQRHLHFFKLGKLQNMLRLYGFQIVTIHNLFLEIPTTSLQGPLRPLQGISRFLTRLKFKTAKFVPHTFAEGWLLLMRRNNDNS